MRILLAMWRVPLAPQWFLSLSRCLNLYSLWWSWSWKRIFSYNSCCYYSLWFECFLFPIKNKSSTYNRSIIGLLPSTLKKMLESALLSVNPRVISNLSILSYHVEPQDLLQSLPMKQSIILPLYFVLYALKHYIPEWQVASYAIVILCIHLGSPNTNIL